jgi:hypothetical protein
MFGARLIPSTLIGTALGAIMMIIGSASEKLGILSVTVGTLTTGTVGPLFGLVGFAVPLAIGLYEDYKDSAKV